MRRVYGEEVRRRAGRRGVDGVEGKRARVQATEAVQRGMGWGRAKKRNMRVRGGESVGECDGEDVKSSTTIPRAAKREWLLRKSA